MQKILTAAATFAALAIGGCTTGAQVPAEVEETYAWCADYMSDLGTNCGFANLEQCRAAISGVGGQCYPNPGRGISPAQGRNTLPE